MIPTELMEEQHRLSHPITTRCCCSCSCLGGTKHCSNSHPGYKRYFVAWMSCLGMITIFAMRCEIGLTVVKITRASTIEVRNASGNSIWVNRPEIVWTDQEIGLIEGASFIGKALFSIPAGFLVTALPANTVWGVAILISSLFNLLLPVAITSSFGYEATLVVRIIQGLAEGCIYPCVPALWRHWAPKYERSRLVTISYFGISLGPIVGFLLTGFVIEQVSWHAIFYIFGAVGVTWSLVWFIFVQEKPSSDTCISVAERDYIELSTCYNPLTCDVNMCAIPWREIFTSMPVYAILVANTGRNWSFQFSQVGLPGYYSDVFHQKESRTGMLLSLPFALMAILTPVAGQLADCIRECGLLSTSSTRKLFNTVGFGVTAICMSIIGFCTEVGAATVLMTIGLGFIGVGMSGFGVNHLDIAPRYAGLLMGLSSGIGTLSGIISPVVVSAVVKTHSAREWQIVFLIAAVVHVITVAFYFTFAAGVQQSWAEKDTDGMPPIDPDDEAVAGAVTVSLSRRPSRSTATQTNTDYGAARDTAKTD